MGDIPALDVLTERFGRALHAQRRPRRHPWGALAVAVACALGFFSAVLLGTTRSQASVPLPVVNGKLAVSYEQIADDADGVAGQFESAGIDIEIVEVPASPSMVGAVRHTGIGEGPDDGQSIAHPLEPLLAASCADARYCAEWWPQGASQYLPPASYEVGVLVPLDFDGFSQIWVGRQARPDEGYRLEAKPWAAGEVLECERILLRTVADVRAVVERKGLTAHWRLNDHGERRVEYDPRTGMIAATHLGLVDDLVVDDITFGASAEEPQALVLWIRRPVPTPETDTERQARLAYESWATRTNTGRC